MFWIGNHRDAPGTFVEIREGRGNPQFEEGDVRDVAEKAMGHSLSPAEISRFWTERSWRDIKNDPVSWVRLLLRKLMLSLNTVELVDTDDIYFYESYSFPLRALNSFWNFGLLLPLALGGVI